MAKDKKGTPDLRKKSADLSLDALLQLKNEKAMEELAWDYAEIFPQARKEYETIARKTLMNKVARVANSASDKSELSRSLESLDARKIQNATPQEKILFYNNRAVLAKKVGDEKSYIESLNALIAQPGLSKDQRESALEQLTGYYEKKLDFKNAYVTALRLESAKVSPKEKEFRLGTLADFAGLEVAGKHYRKALAAGLMGERSLIVRSRLVLMSENPARELKTQSRDLKQKPALLNETTLLVYAKIGDAKSLQSVLDLKEMRKQPAALFIKKQSFYGKAQDVKATIASHQLNTSKDRLLQKSIAERVQLLKKADKLLADSLTLKDVTAQMMALNVVSSENERMVRELAGSSIACEFNDEKEKLNIFLC